MSRNQGATATPRCRDLAATGRPDQPIGFFLTENLLAARAGSMFPTNGSGPDEDVNVYLGHLLGRFLQGDHDPRVRFGSGALLAPPARTASPRQRAGHYRANGDHRLLMLGLFGRGDDVRRRGVLHGLSAAETRSRDVAAGRTCYEAAANALRGRGLESDAAVAVLDKLANHFEDYVHVLGALATRHLGLGARLSDDSLARLLPPDTTAVTRTVAELITAPPPPASVDALLDLWLENQKNPAPGANARMREMADRLGVSWPPG